MQFTTSEIIVLFILCNNAHCQRCHINNSSQKE